MLKTRQAYKKEILYNVEEYRKMWDKILERNLSRDDLETLLRVSQIQSEGVLGIQRLLETKGTVI